MSRVIRQRMTSMIEGDFIVFFIGIRINKLWKVHKWLPVFLAMPKMLQELSQRPDSGLLGFHFHNGLRNHLVVQYWRSFEQLQIYARDRNKDHFPAWLAFNQRVGSSGDVGIWHETYCVKTNQYETIYNNMPAYGLGAATKLVPPSGRRATAAGRLGLSEHDGAPVDTAGTIGE